MLLDTHVWAWSLIEPEFLSGPARLSLEGATGLAISAVTFYEIAQKVRLGKWPKMAAYLDRLAALAATQSIAVLPVAGEVGLLAGRLDWLHRDPFDRILAATSLTMGLPLISGDTAFDAVPGLRRIWKARADRVQSESD